MGRRFLASLIAVATLSGCDSGTEPNLATAAELEGIWTFTLDDGVGRCSPDYNPYDHYLITADDLPEPLSNGAVNIVGEWKRSLTSDFSWVATGSINVRTGAVELHFWWSDMEDQIEINGTLREDLTISGTWVSTGINYSAGCAGTLTGSKD